MEIDWDIVRVNVGHYKFPCHTVDGVCFVCESKSGGLEIPCDNGGIKKIKRDYIMLYLRERERARGD